MSAESTEKHGKDIGDSRSPEFQHEQKIDGGGGQDGLLPAVTNVRIAIGIGGTICFYSTASSKADNTFEEIMDWSSKPLVNRLRSIGTTQSGDHT
jgi:hypothetical protein